MHLLSHILHPWPELASFAIHTGSMLIDAGDIAHGVWEIAKLGKVAAGISGILVSLIELACTLPVHTLPPEQVLPTLAQPMIDMLAGIGLDSVELFCGAGLDVTATDCEIKLTLLFKSLDQARQATMNMNRPQWIVVSWRTDQSNSFKIIDSQ